MVKLNKLLLSSTIISCLSLLYSLNADSITISPATKVIETQPGVAQTFSIKILNDGNEKASIECYMSDLDIDKNGNKIFKPVGTTKNSVAKYINIAEPKKFILGVNETKEVLLSINVPKGIIGGNKAIAFFQAKPVNDTLNGKKLIMSVRAGATILQETAGTTDIKSRITSVDVEEPSNVSPLKLKMKVKNEGNTHVTATGTVAIVDSNESFIGTMDLSKTIVYPNREAVLEGRLINNTSLKSGMYHALITYQYRDKSISIDKVFYIK